VADVVKKDEEFSGTRPVEERQRFDEPRLDAWMRENVEGYQGPLVVLQFKGGQSNPTYRLDTPGRSYVMRRKPFGKLLPSATIANTA
jgi:aminoglycoside phosphotransferase (APT) family kinase protein